MLPSKIRVKILSEAAGYITVTEVVQRDFTFVQLVEFLLPVTGSDMHRIRQILRAGGISRGEYRYRWDSMEVEKEEIESALEALPHAEPARAFQPDAGVRVRFRRGHGSLELSRESASRKPLFARQSFWEGMVGFFRDRVRYADYSHLDQADVFALDMDAEARRILESLLPLLRPKSTAARLERLKPERIEWLIRR